MAMNGIDISPWQASLDLLAISYDFVIMKATEGMTYVSPDCDAKYQQAKALGKKRAVYHFIDFEADAVAQADFFVDNCAGYIRDAIFVLDWEGAGVADVGAALRFLQRVEQRIGYKPAIYMSEYVENAYDWSAVVAGDYGLWAAKYADYEIDNNYDMSGAGQPPRIVHWDFYFAWQWTSKGRLSGYAGDLDCDIAYLTPPQWDLYAGLQSEPSTPAPEPSTTTTTTVPAPDDLDPGEVTTTTTTTEPMTATTTTSTTTDAPVTTTTTTKAPDQGAALLEAFKEILRLAVFALPALLIQVLTSNPDAAFGYGVPILAALRYLDKYIHDNPNTNLNGLLPF